MFADCTAGLFDGFRLDTAGRIWTSAADGVHCYDPDGTLIGKVLVPEVVANVCFGGPKRNYLYICGTTSLYGVRLPVNGLVDPLSWRWTHSPALSGALEGPNLHHLKLL